MQIKIVILPDGQLSAFVESGTYEEGKQNLERLLGTLGAQGIKFAEVGAVEQHRHDDQNAHLSEVNHASH
jgi:hypothetical protein